MSIDVDAVPLETMIGLILKNGVGQEAGVVAERVTSPEKPLALATETVEFALEP